MAGVSVEKAALLGAISLCNESINNFQKTSSVLSKKYQSAGSDWRDNKYTQLGTIVNECNTALNQPVKQLQECITKLNELLKAVDEYENIHINI